MNMNILKLGVILALFAAGACVALAAVYTVTKPAIEGHEAKRLEMSLKDLFPEADAFTDINGSIAASLSDVKVNGSWKATKGDAILGVAIKVTGKSYGGDAAMLVGVGTDRRLVGVRILELTDTPGLGANATSPTYFVDESSNTTFPGQFTGKALSDPFEVKKDIVAITASTITSKALTLIAKAAGQAGGQWLEKAAEGGM
ncbi:MAG: FMN-binding protein [Spirochaetales bacterium]|nr:FMN-binding protein [Spirochaetales bacterium]MBP7264290.1 FMN-binding protein [Spirochaetia bacterium]